MPWPPEPRGATGEPGPRMSEGGAPMHALRLSLAGTVLLALLGGLGGVVVAQADEEVHHGPFFAEFDDVSMSDPVWEAGPGFGRTSDWEVVYEDVVATDPRLSGTWTVILNGHGMGSFDDPDRFGVYTGTARLENEGGAWVGEVLNFNSEPYERVRMVVEGEGAYAGWTAIIDQADQEWSGFRGVVFAFGLPPLPDPVEVPAE